MIGSRRIGLASTLALVLMAQPALATVAPKMTVRHVQRDGEQQLLLKVELTPVGDPPAGCVRNRKVVFQKEGEQGFNRFGAARTNRRGIAKIFRIRKKNHMGIFRTNVPAKALGTGLICPAERSPVVEHFHAK